MQAGHLACSSRPADRSRKSPGALAVRISDLSRVYSQSPALLDAWNFAWHYGVGEGARMQKLARNWKQQA
jgi:hypothetical protein